jgi:hypothetical protein
MGSEHYRGRYGLVDHADCGGEKVGKALQNIV